MAEKELVRVTDLSYEDEGDLVVKLVGRTKDRNRVVRHIYGTEPYCFVPVDAPKPDELGVDADIVDVRVSDKTVAGRGDFESYDNRALQQIVTRVPSGVSTVRKAYESAGWEVFESDIPYVRRCTADYGLAGYVRIPQKQNVQIEEVESVEASEVERIEPRTCIADIEVVFPERFTDEFAEEAPNEVTAITAYDSYDDEYTLFCLDPDRRVDPGVVRNEVDKHWEGHEDAEEYTDAGIVFKRHGDETALLEDWIYYLQEKRPDIISGWNWIDFDHEYLFNRIRDNNDLNEHALSDVGSVGGWKTERYIPGMPAIDMMGAFCGKISRRNWESRSLDYVADEQLSVGKVEGDEVTYEKDRSKFMAYNIVDTQLCVALDDQQAIFQFWYQLSDITSIPIYSVGSTMKECEGFLFKHRSHDEILPDTNEEEIDDISGGFVMPPSEGLQEWVGVVDLKSLYPSTIITCNMSKETMTTDPSEADIIVPDMPLNYEQVSGPGITEGDIGWELGGGSSIGFSLDEEGILPKYLKLLFKERERLKGLRDEHDPKSSEYQRYDLQQRVIKVIMNSFFGVSDNPYFRLSADGLGGAITGASRYVNWYGVQEIESMGYEVIYGDTDSLFVSLGDKGIQKDEIVDRGLELEEELNNRMAPIADDFGIPEDHPYVDVGDMPHDSLPDDGNHLWQYEFEKLYQRFFQPGVKKRYAGHVVWKEGKEVDDTDTVGIEANRSDSPEITGDIQEKFLELVLKGEDFDVISDFVQEEVEKVQNLEYGIREIGVPSVINKPLEEYPNRPTKRACQFMNEHIDGYDWRPGDNPWIVYVQSTPVGTPNCDVAALEWTDHDVPHGFELEANEHVEKAIKQPIDQIIKALDYSWSELKSGKKEQSVVGTGGGEVDFGNSEVEKPDWGDDSGGSPKQGGVMDWGDGNE